MVKDVFVQTVWEVPDVFVRTGVWEYAPFSENDCVGLNRCVILAKATIPQMLTSFLFSASSDSSASQTFMYNLLPPELVRQCYAFDNTYHEIYKNVLQEMLSPELTALLRCVKGLKNVTFCQDDCNFFMTERGIFLVCAVDMRYTYADYFDSDLIEAPGLEGGFGGEVVGLYYDLMGATWQSNFNTLDNIDAAAAKHGWPALLRCVDGFEKQCIVAHTTYYVYQYQVDGALMNDIRRGKYRVDLTLN
jgi:hypothetical protein